MARTSMLLLLLRALLISVSVECFQIGVVQSLRQSTLLFSEPRQPRRNLKKRRSRRQRNDQGDDDDSVWESAELRPLIAATAIEAGEDYWIDEKDLEASRAREEAIKNRKALEGEIPKEKLWEETLAPYKQNWIGFISIIVVVLATIVTKFPELLETPSPTFPDL